MGIIGFVKGLKIKLRPIDITPADITTLGTSAIPDTISIPIQEETPMKGPNTMPLKPPSERNKGANTMKSRTIAFLRREIKRLGTAEEARCYQRTIDFLLSTDERAAKRPGGIGRK